MNILMIGDIFARPGRRIVRECIDEIVRTHDVDFVVANAENAAGGFGLTRDIVRELFGYGVHVLTGGNHTWDKREIMTVLEDDERVLRPHNYPADNPGSGVYVGRHEGVTIAVMNLQGRVFMPPTDCPFKAADRVIESVADEADIILVDGNPLEDLSVIGASASMFGTEPRPTPSVDTIPLVMKDGVVFKNTLN